MGSLGCVWECEIFPVAGEGECSGGVYLPPPAFGRRSPSFCGRRQEESLALWTGRLGLPGAPERRCGLRAYPPAALGVAVLPLRREAFGVGRRQQSISGKYLPERTCGFAPEQHGSSQKAPAAEGAVSLWLTEDILSAAVSKAYIKALSPLPIPPYHKREKV